MNDMEQIIESLENSEKPVTGCFPLYPPVELLHAMGMLPVTMWGLRGITGAMPLADAHVQNYACSVSRRLAEFVLSGGGSCLDSILFYNACDTLRNMPELLRRGMAENGRDIPFFRLHIPMAGAGSGFNKDYLSQQIEELISDIEKSFSVEFDLDKFRESVEMYRKNRELYKRLEKKTAEGLLPFGELAAMAESAAFITVEKQVERFEEALAEAENRAAPAGDPVSVIVSGLMPPPRAICDEIERCGFRVAGNDIAPMARSGSFTPESFENAADYYAQFYSGHHPCPTLLYTADDRPGRLRELAADTGADGVIFIGEKFCEYEYFEFPFMQKMLDDMGVKTILLEFSIDDGKETAPYRTRIQAFRELLSE